MGTIRNVFFGDMGRPKPSVPKTNELVVLHPVVVLSIYLYYVQADLFYHEVVTI